MHPKPNIDYTQSPHRGSYVYTPWSSQVVVKEVLLSVSVPDRVYYGVEVETQDTLGLDWPNTTSLLWVYDDGQKFRLGDEFQHRPLQFEEDPGPEMAKVIGCHELNGRAYIGVQWKEYGAPTWELESELGLYQDILTDHYLSIYQSI